MESKDLLLDEMSYVEFTTRLKSEHENLRREK